MTNKQEASQGAAEGTDGAKEKKKEKKATVKIRPESIKLELFGDIMKFSKKNAKEILPLKKYDALAMYLLNEERQKRVMIYLFLCGLSLSATARRMTDVEKRRQIFDLKNRIFLTIANAFEMRKVLNFRFCVSKRFRVTKYCDDCTKRNSVDDKPKREWTFCQKCEVDRTYYNVLSMFHKFKGGGVSLYLGKEYIQQVIGLKPVKHVDLDDLPEQLSFENFRFTPHNLVSLDLASVIECSNKLLPLFEKLAQPPSQSESFRPGDGGQGRSVGSDRSGDRNSRDGFRPAGPRDDRRYDSRRPPAQRTFHRPEGKDFPPKKS